MQDLLKIVLVVLVLLFLIKKKVDLGSVLFFGAVLSGLLFGLEVKRLFLDLFKALISFETLSLIGIIILVLYLGNFLQTEGNFKILVDSLKNLVPEARLILAIPPVFIGLLPMLGGALMSAPIVKEASRRWKLSPAWKTFLNYWFRHIWEYCWPLYVNLIMASAILQIPIKKISSVQFPFTILAAVIGLILLFKHVPYLPKERKSNRFLKNLYNLFFSLWPILLVIFLIFALRLHMLVSLAITAFLTQILSRMKLRDRMRLLWKSISLRTIFLLASVMMFKKILDTSGALSSLTQVFRPEGASAYFLLFTIPFLLGLLTGVNHAFIGISFPILLPIFGLPHPDLVLVMFAYVSGFVGILLSPAHLCLMLTVDYFQADLRSVYRILIWPCLIVFTASFLVLLFLRII